LYSDAAMTCSSGSWVKSGVATVGSPIQMPAPPGKDETRPSSCWTSSAVLARAGAGAETAMTRETTRTKPTVRTHRR